MSQVAALFASLVFSTARVTALQSDDNHLTAP
jgi:hypothetical protein